MRPLLLFLIVAAFLASIVGAKAEYEVVPATAQITSVTLFQGAALQTRVASVELPAGYSTVELSGLPLAIVAENTIVQGKGSFTLQSTEFRTKWEKLPPSEEVKTLVAQLEKLDDELTMLGAKLEALKQSEGFYKNLYPISPADVKDTPLADMTIDGCKALLDTVEAGLSNVYQSRRETNSRVTKLQAERNALVTRIKELGGSDVRFNVARVTIKAAEKTKATLELLSLVGGCTWNTNYDARLLENGSVEFQYYADITQTTKEDWNDIALRLSTSSITNLVLPPELQRWALTLQAKEREESRGSKSGWSLFGARTYSKAPSADKGDYKADEPQAEAESLGGGVAVEFSLPSKATIPGDGTLRRLSVQKLNFTGELVYEAMPRISPYAFARVELVNDSPYPLLEGNLKAYSGGELLGSTRIKTVSTGEKFKLYFGTDANIEIKYRPLKSKKDQTWRREEVEFEWLIEIKNNRTNPVTLFVTDAMPKPANEEITIRSPKISPNPTEDWTKQIDRLIKWQINLKPAEKQTLSVAFKVTVPKGKELFWSGVWEGGER